MKKQAHILVSGIVQGVFFRASVREEANRLGLVGGAFNLADGSVQIDAQGDEESLRTLIDWCRHGPRGAQVEGIQVEWKDKLEEWSGFRIG